MVRDDQPGELDALYRDLFETDRRGQTILADLARRFVRPPPRGFDAAAMNETFARAHQRAVIDYILGRIDWANGVQDAGKGD
jgi:hypothetical protein